MKLYRISIYQSLEGQGGIRASARWNTAGRPIVYLAETAASALLEVLAHLRLDREDLPSNYQLLHVEASAGITIEDLDPSPIAEWTARPDLTQKLGDAWLRSGRTALARVPSAIAAETFNYLLNPAHLEATGVRIVKQSLHPYDPRLLRRI